jgi:glutamate formiminotransferase
VEAAAFAAIRTAVAAIDMRRHQGLHPRVGAADVCPFVPLEGSTLSDCAELARRVGRRVGEELQVPVFLYEAAAASPQRAPLPAIRRGGAAGLAMRLADPAWQPDFGPAALSPSAGACVIGARKLLVALNLSLDREDDSLAREIAGALRRRGWALRAIGWTLPAPRRSQVSCNLTDLDRTPLHAVVAACREEAGRRGAQVTGAEIVGLVPLETLIQAGRAALATAGRRGPEPDAEGLVAAAVSWLGLESFDPRRKILEWVLAAPPGGDGGRSSL